MNRAPDPSEWFEDLEGDDRLTVSFRVGGEMMICHVSVDECPVDTPHRESSCRWLHALPKRGTEIEVDLSVARVFVAVVKCLTCARVSRTASGGSFRPAEMKCPWCGETGMRLDLVES